MDKLNEFMMFIILQDKLYVAGRLNTSEYHTLWFLMFVKVPAAVLLLMLLIALFHCIIKFVFKWIRPIL